MGRRSGFKGGRVSPSRLACELPERYWDRADKSAANHIASEGLVPIVCTDASAATFSSHAAVVQITAPFHQAVPEHTVIVLLDDLHLFTQTWFYSALSYPMLNDRLSTTFELRNPSTPVGVQKRLLLPFTQIKGLYQMEVRGYADGIKRALEAGMAVPIRGLAECCDAAVCEMERGDAEMQEGRAQEALDAYIAAFRAIHILIHNRTRRVLADVFFHASITTGRFAGQTGMTVRVVLRLKLVARVVLAHLRLGSPDEAAFWGMRSIRIMRESMDVEFEDFLAEFVGGEDVGLIYVRTGVAVWMLEGQGAGYEGEGSEKIWGLARKFLRGRRKDGVRRELEGFGCPVEVVGLFADEGDDGGSLVARDGSGEDE